MLQNKQSNEFGCVAYQVIFASVVQQGQKKAIMDSTRSGYDPSQYFDKN